MSDESPKEKDGIQVESKPAKRLDTRAKEPGKNIERQNKHVQIQAEKVGMSDFQKMRAAGYSFSYSRHPKRAKGKATFRELLDEYLPDEQLMSSHVALLNSRRLDHMTFPINIEDEVIADMLASANCLLRKIIHGEQAKHAYFWSPDNKARKDALDMAFKLKGQYAPEKIEDVTDPYRKLPTDELLKRKKEALDFLKKRK